MALLGILLMFAALAWLWRSAFGVRKVQAWRWRVRIVLVAATLIVMIGFSRLYLGIH